jgi:hypothetical protein
MNNPDLIGDAQDKLIAEMAAQPEQEPVEWRNAAIRLGEELSSVGPDGYYNMTAAQWLDWALEQQPRGKNSFTTPPAAQPAMFGPMGTVGDLFDKHVIANGNLKKEWIVYLEKNT